jgi:hypothetical protein
MRLFLGFLLLVTACDVPVLRPQEAGIGDAGRLSGTACGAGLVVAATDGVQSANIGIIDNDGHVLSSSVLSTASAAANASTALGGDLAFPSAPGTSHEIVILDRYPSSVITWLDSATAQVRAQLSVATGFAANPHDYVPLAADKALVTRFDSNPQPGRQPFDAGGDLLVVNPETPEIMRRIDLSGELPPVGGYFAHPDRARLLDGLVYVVVPFYDAHHRSGDSYLAVLDPASERIVDTLLIQGVTGCSGLDASPDGTTLAIACSGSWQGTSQAQANVSAIVGVTTAPRLQEIWRVGTGDDERAFGFGVVFADATRVLATRLGVLGPPVINDAAVLIDTRQGSATTLFESASKPASLDIGPCLTACGQCFIADASRKQVVRVEFAPNQAGYRLTRFNWHDPVGLPPRRLALFAGPSSSD